MVVWGLGLLLLSVWDSLTFARLNKYRLLLFKTACRGSGVLVDSRWCYPTNRKHTMRKSIKHSSQNGMLCSGKCHRSSGESLQPFRRMYVKSGKMYTSSSFLFSYSPLFFYMDIPSFRNLRASLGIFLGCGRAKVS